MISSDINETNFSTTTSIEANYKITGNRIDILENPVELQITEPNYLILLQFIDKVKHHIYDNLLYTIYIINKTKYYFQNIKLVDVLPNNTSFIGTTIPIGKYSFTNGMVIYNLDCLSGYSVMKIELLLRPLALGTLENFIAIVSKDFAKHTINNPSLILNKVII